MNSTENIKVTKVTYLGNRVWGHVCPVCGKILASWSEDGIFPEFSLCECKIQKEEKK